MRILMIILMGLTVSQIASAYPSEGVYFPIQSCDGAVDGNHMKITVFATPRMAAMAMYKLDGEKTVLMNARLTRKPDGRTISVSIPELGTFSVIDGQNSSPDLMGRDGTVIGLRCQAIF